MPDIVPFWTPGESITCHAEAAVIGGRFVAISGPRVGGNIQISPATAAQGAFGVAARDRGIGEKALVFAKPGQIVPVRTGEALTANDEVEVGAAGVAMKLANGVAVGRACDDAGNGTDCPIRLYDGAGFESAFAQGAAIDDLAVTMPADAPATVDALRDDLVANALTDIEDKVNEIIAALEAANITA